MAGNLEDHKKTMCCLKECRVSTTRELALKDSWVGVRAFEPERQQRAMAVDWQANGEASFHWGCWAELVRACSDPTSPFSLSESDVERSMIFEAHKTAEYHHSEKFVSDEAERIANILKHSRYCIAFTGAGISTAAGIGDFRGKDGKWTEREKVKIYGAKGFKKASGRTPIENFRPTYTHEALAKLIEMGLVKFLISQNTDGLHRLSGIPADKLAELHGNCFVEKCEICQTRYERSSVNWQRSKTVPEKKCKQCHICHRTGRKCSQPGCEGYLMNTIINFGDRLESHVLECAEDHAKLSDSVIVLGSTLAVTPANNLVTKGQQPVRLIICNRQTTDYDKYCLKTGPDGTRHGSRVYGDCDSLMKKIMASLLTPTELQAWENGRQERMVEYSLKRTAIM